MPISESEGSNIKWYDGFYNKEGKKLGWGVASGLWKEAYIFN